MAGARAEGPHERRGLLDGVRGAGADRGLVREHDAGVAARHEVVEVAFVFVAIGAVLAALAFLLGRAWRPLP